MASKNCVKYIFLILFGVITLGICLFREPYWDEANAWMIAKQFSVFEVIFDVERQHPSMWHLIQMPFAKNDFLYPWSIYIINWVFCMVGMVFFWNKAPFSNLEKALVTFSFPFVCYFGVVARCYSLGVMFLFILLSFWKERLKRPVLTSILIILLANTSAMALCASVALGAIFLFDLIKNKIKSVGAYGILAFGAFIIWLQVFSAALPEYFMAVQPRFQDIIANFFYSFDIKTFYDVFEKIFQVFIFALLFSSVTLFFRNFRVLFFITSVYSMMFYIFFFKYQGSWWHYLFFYVYFISALWIFREDNSDKEDKLVKFVNILFVILSLFFCLKTFSVPFIKRPPFVFESTANRLYKIVKQGGILNGNYKIYALDDVSNSCVALLPYFKKIPVYNAYGDVKYSMEGFKHYLTDAFKDTDIDKLALSLDKEKTNIGLSDNKIPPGYYRGNEHTILLYPVYISANPQLTVFEIVNVK